MVAETVTLRLILYGLVAFAPDRDENPTRLHALLVDAGGQQFASDGCKIHRHVPVLYVDAEQCTIEGKQCRISDQIDMPDDPISGGWKLDRESLQVEIVPPPSRPSSPLPSATPSEQVFQIFSPARAAAGLPVSNADGKSWEWIPQVGGVRIDPDCLGQAHDCPVAARLEIDKGEVASCHLSEAQDSFKVFAWELKPLKSASAPIVRQAMSDAVVVTLHIPRGATVKLTSRDFRKPSWIKREIVLDAGEDGENIDVWLANVPSHESVVLEHAETCHNDANIVDRHFELYYGLSAEPLPYSQRFVPHRVDSVSVDGVAVQRLPDDPCRLLTFGGLDGDRTRAVAHGHHGEIPPGKVPMDWNSCGSVRFSAPPEQSLVGGGAP